MLWDSLQAFHHTRQLTTERSGQALITKWLLYEYYLSRFPSSRELHCIQTPWLLNVIIQLPWSKSLHHLSWNELYHHLLPAKSKVGCELHIKVLFYTENNFFSREPTNVLWNLKTIHQLQINPNLRTMYNEPFILYIA